MYSSEQPTPKQPPTAETNLPRQSWHKPQLVELPIRSTASGDFPGVEGSGIFEGEDLVMFTNSS